MPNSQDPSDDPVVVSLTPLVTFAQPIFLKGTPTKLNLEVSSKSSGSSFKSASSNATHINHYSQRGIPKNTL
jgi:hypothetical protein